MALTERTVIGQVSIDPESQTVSVRTDTVIERDGVEISRQYHRKAYVASQQAEFESEVPDAANYIAAIGW